MTVKLECVNESRLAYAIVIRIRKIAIIITVIIVNKNKENVKRNLKLILSLCKES